MKLFIVGLNTKGFALLLSIPMGITPSYEALCGWSDTQSTTCFIVRAFQSVWTPSEFVTEIIVLLDIIVVLIPKLNESGPIGFCGL